MPEGSKKSQGITLRGLFGYSEVDSHSKCTTPSFLKDFMRGSVAEAFAGSMIELFDDRRKCFFGDVSEI